MLSEEVMNPCNDPQNQDQTGQNNEKPFYYFFKLDFILLFLHEL